MSAMAEKTNAKLNAGQRIAMHYFIAAMVLFFAQIVFGMIAGLQFLFPDLFYNQLDFNVTRMVHIDAMIVWMLLGFIGAVYWLIEDEAGTELVGAKLALLNFWILIAAVAVVVVVFLLIQERCRPPEGGGHMATWTSLGHETEPVADVHATPSRRSARLNSA